jgi:hypothetical protein
MWIALISALLGAGAVLAPPILHEVTVARAHRRELERLRLASELRRAEGDEGAAEPAKRPRTKRKAATHAGPREAAPAETGSGFREIDRLNALLAPVVAYAILALFVIVALFYSFAIVEKYREGRIPELIDVSRAIWDSMVGDVVQAVLGYLFGFHLTRVAVDRFARPVAPSD